VKILLGECVDQRLAEGFAGGLAQGARVAQTYAFFAFVCGSSSVHGS